MGNHLTSAYCMFLKIAGACIYQIRMLQYKLYNYKYLPLYNY